MLNTDAAAHKTPKTPSQATFEQAIHTPSGNGSSHNPPEPSHKDRPSPYPPPLRPPDQRSPGASYFSLQSPYQNNSASTSASTPASTWSAGAPSINSQSPGTHGQPYTPRDGFPSHQPHNASFIPSTSPLVPQPSPPGALPYHQNYSAHPAHPSAPPPRHFGPQLSSETSLPPSGLPSGHIHQVSPNTPFQPQPTAPLGPPAQLQRPSPQVQRPPSQGYDHHRTYSSGSVGSVHSREIISSHLASPEQIRRESLQRQYSMERERSISVSPKTIPRPSPYRQVGTEIRQQSRNTPPISIKPDPEPSIPLPNAPVEAQMESQHAASTPQSASQTPKDNHITPNTNSARPSPTPTSQILTPKSTHTSLPASQSPQTQKLPTLKRNASLVSSMSVLSQPARKRLRRDEIPIFAQSARQGRPLRLIRGPGRSVAVSAPSHSDHPVNGNPAANGHAPVTTPLQQAAPHWEPSITNEEPYEDLTQSICDWIIQTIGMATPPSGGAMFEIEAKIGEIFDVEEGTRIRLPVLTEAIFNKNVYRRTKFESSMNMVSLCSAPVSLADADSNRNNTSN
jgi:mRNA capping enzyme, beta chain